MGEQPYFFLHPAPKLHSVFTRRPLLGHWQEAQRCSFFRALTAYVRTLLTAAYADRGLTAEPFAVSTNVHAQRRSRERQRPSVDRARCRPLQAVRAISVDAVMRQGRLVGGFAHFAHAEAIEERIMAALEHAAAAA